MPQTNPKSESFMIKYFLSCASAACAESVTYPLDITKTRLQLQNELSKTGASAGKKQIRHGMVRTAMNIGTVFITFAN